MMFQEKLLKVLVATETMSTGLNMPTKTVVFTSPRKFDGTGYRWISSASTCRWRVARVVAAWTIAVW